MFAIAVALPLVAACQSSSDPKVDIDDVDQRIAYAIGLDIGERMQEQELNINPAIVAKGLRDGFAGQGLLDEAGKREAMMAFQQQMMAKMREQQMGARQGGDPELAAKNLEEGRNFLEENARRDGVQVTENGLQYEVVEAGSGPIPTVDNVVRVHYTGQLIDGTVFDSSVQRGEPVEFPITGVIPGWVEALQLMPVGSKWKLFIPADLAYGKSGTPGGPIGPNATLIFDVELLDIVQ